MNDMGRVFNQAKAKALHNILAPVGFSRGSRLFVRQMGEQIHGIEFQTSKYGGEYFLNIAFHYSFLAPLLAMSQGVDRDVQDFHLLDFMLWTRVEDFMPPGYPCDWRYDIEEKKLGEQLNQNARDALGVLDVFSAKWSDPAVFLSILPPEVVTEDYQQRTGRAKIDTESLGSLPPLPIKQAIGLGWHIPHYTDLCYCLGIIAIKLGKVSFAKAYLAFGESCSEDGRGQNALGMLQLAIEQRHN